MVVMAEKPLPMDLEGYNQVFTKYTERSSWKIIELVDAIQAKRAAKIDKTQVRRVSEKELKEG